MSDVGNCYFYLEQYDSALKYYNYSFANSSASNNTLGYAFSYNNIGLVYFKKGEYGKALNNYYTALNYYYKLGMLQGITNCLDNICKTYIAKKDYANALKEANLALRYAFQLKDRGLAYIIYIDLSNVYAGKRDFEKAYFYQKVITSYADSIYGASKASSDAALQARLSVLQKENENKLLRLEQAKQTIQLKQKNFETLIIGIFLILAISVVIYFFWNSRQRAGAMNLLRQQHDVIENKNNELDDLNTKLQSQKSELEEINHLKDKLFSIISHDIRSPLVSFSSFLSFLESDELSEDTIKELNQEMTERLNLTLNFVDNLIEWAQSQMHGGNTIPENVNLNMIADEIRKLCTHQADLKGIKIANDIPANINVYTNAGMIKMVLRNLISNAIKFSAKDDVVTITADEKNGTVNICVKDTGVGMKPEIMNQLFLGKTTSRLGTAQEKGSGLGLTLCKEFLEKYHGTMTVTSEEGVGSTFCFRIPAIHKLQPVQESIV